MSGHKNSKKNAEKKAKVKKEIKVKQPKSSIKENRKMNVSLTSAIPEAKNRIYPYSMGVIPSCFSFILPEYFTTKLAKETLVQVKSMPEREILNYTVPRYLLVNVPNSQNKIDLNLPSNTFINIGKPFKYWK